MLTAGYCSPASARAGLVRVATSAPTSIVTDEQYTRCPGCKTVFRVTDAQLALRDGQVRCGHCQTVFNGRDQFISLAPKPPTTLVPGADELSLGPPTVTLRSADALDPPPPPEPERTPRDTSVDYENRFARDRKRRARLITRLSAIAIPVLLIALVAQGAFHFRDALAAHWPAMRGPLHRLCSAAGCEIRPLREIAALVIEASDLQADPAHKGLLILTAMLRNRAAYPQAFPHFEFTLTDAQDQVVARRALAPADYMRGTADLAQGIPSNGEAQIKLFVDASATTQAGYRLYLFFP